MSATAWTKWFWADWQADPGLRLCSLAARGLWFEMLCIAGQSGEQFGYVAIDKQPITHEDLAKLAGTTVEEVDRLIVELEHNRVFSRNRVGKIYCRRMIRAVKSQKNGKVGGRPSADSAKEKSYQVKVSPRARARARPGSHKPIAISHKPEAKQQQSARATPPLTNGHAAAPLEDLETRLREAAGWTSDPAVKLCITGGIQRLIDAGADLAADVLPVVRAYAPLAKAKTWKFFEGPISDAMQARLRGDGPPVRIANDKDAQRAAARARIEAHNAKHGRKANGSG